MKYIFKKKQKTISKSNSKLKLRPLGSNIILSINLAFLFRVNIFLYIFKNKTHDLNNYSRIMESFILASKTPFLFSL